MKEILLTRGYVATVNDEGHDLANPFKWCASVIRRKDGSIRHVYAYRKANGQTILLHRFLLGITDQKTRVDHKDGDGLNNLSSNLRIATCSQNQSNQKKCKTTTSSVYKGVTWYKRDSKWAAQIMQDGKRKYLGSFSNELQAALAYDKTARYMFGEFARTNF